MHDPSHPRLIARPPKSTPADGAAARRHRRDLPPDLLRQASQRLGAISLLTGALWVVATILYHLVDRADDPRWASLQPTDAMVAAATAISLALYFYIRRSPHDPRWIMDLGLIYMVVNAFIAGVILHWDTPVADQKLDPSLSWIGIMVLLFAAALPNRPAKVVGAGLICVSMNPIGMLIARARGHWHFEHVGQAWLMHYPDLLILGIAVVITRVVSGLGHQVAKAREMGSYQLGDLIGRGGMGEVYKATHRMLARPAAVKLIRPEMFAERHGGGAEMAAVRFRREAEAAANLRSPHTVELYDFGVTDDGTLYFAMELLDGLDLESLVRQTGPLPSSRVIRILRQAAESLEEAHARGLVHRDIKPANIHLGRLGLQHDFTKVLDFGLVTAPAARPGGPTLATAAGVVPGTPAYMAPEMALGETIDGRADLYSLGCVAYFLLTGRLVFDAEGALQTLVRRLHEEPAPPSAKAELPVPPALDAVVLACLAKRPDDRPRDAATLRRLLDAIDITPWTDDMAAQWWAQHQPRRTGPVKESWPERPTATAV
jgi:serine/threonine-protein kinase